MTGAEREARHSEPVWGERSDFIIGADVSAYSEVADREQLWARRLGENRFELCCIPFFLYDVALGDVVETAPVGDRSFMLRRVIERSGRYVFRVWFGQTEQPREDVVARLASLGALLEWSSANLLAVDAKDQAHAQEITDHLAAAQADGRLVFERGRLS